MASEGLGSSWLWLLSLPAFPGLTMSYSGVLQGGLFGSQLFLFFKKISQNILSTQNNNSSTTTKA